MVVHFYQGFGVWGESDSNFLASAVSWEPSRCWVSGTVRGSKTGDDETGVDETGVISEFP